MGSGGDGLGRSQASQIRSQSQQSFSQGMSLSQLSQNSFEEPLVNDQVLSCISVVNVQDYYLDCRMSFYTTVFE
ncbi:hypothetical protein B296_00013091 [Ensete ventricosum]|uniref:Uncharacterized protein n=1 Tax=Ensete ventricosum TaxID=4639 RepID=A0A427B8T5_ENSVE|nr:hypothetical protein B296_00013091 [Ensete ventricosum]